MPSAKRTRKRSTLPPLQRIDFRLVQTPLDGLLINVDRDLQRRTKDAERFGSFDMARQLVLLDIFVRLVTNAYHAEAYLIADDPPDSRRKPQFVLVLPPINRQLLDLFCSLVYMLDDLPSRSLQYQRAGWRQIAQERDKVREEVGKRPEWKRDPAWREYLRAYDRVLNFYGQIYGITPDQAKNPRKLPEWYAPFKLKDLQTQSRNFLRWIVKWLYADTSEVSHVSFSGLVVFSAPILLADIAGGEDQEIIENRTTQQVRFHQFSRAVTVALATCAELENKLNLGNKDTIINLWGVWSTQVPEAKEMFEFRY